jgi:hypothetical protein
MRKLTFYIVLLVTGFVISKSQGCIGESVPAGTFNENHRKIQMRFDSIDFQIDSLFKMALISDENQEILKSNQIKFEANQDTIKSGLKVIHQDMTKQNIESNYLDNLINFLK